MIQKKTVIRNQNTKRTDERIGKTSKKEDCGKIHENVFSVHSVALLSTHNTFKHIRIIHNVHNILENPNIFSTHKVLLAAECTEDHETKNVIHFTIYDLKLDMYCLKVVLTCQNVKE